MKPRAPKKRRAMASQWRRRESQSCRMATQSTRKKNRPITWIEGLYACRHPLWRHFHVLASPRPTPYTGWPWTRHGTLKAKESKASLSRKKLPNYLQSSHLRLQQPFLEAFSKGAHAFTTFYVAPACSSTRPRVEHPFANPRRPILDQRQ